MGGFDVFSAVGKESQWDQVENIGYPHNSSVDDLYYIIDDDEKDGFVVSNRPGGFSLKSETCCDDIYQFQIIKEDLIQFVIVVLTSMDDYLLHITVQGSHHS